MKKSQLTSIPSHARPVHKAERINLSIITILQFPKREKTSCSGNFNVLIILEITVKMILLICSKSLWHQALSRPNLFSVVVVAFSCLLSFLVPSYGYFSFIVSSYSPKQIFVVVVVVAQSNKSDNKSKEQQSSRKASLLLIHIPIDNIPVFRETY